MPQDISANNKRIARNTAFLYLRMAFVLIVSIYTTRVILKTLGVEDFGINNVVTGFVALFGFLSQTLSSAIQRFYNFDLGKNQGKNLKDVYITSLTVQLLLSFIILLLGETVGLWYINRVMVLSPERLEAANRLYQFAVISFVVGILTVPYRAAINAFERMDFFAVVSVVDVLLKLGIVIALPWIPCDKLSMYGFLLLCVMVFDLAVYYFYCKVQLDFIHFAFKPNKQLLNSILSFSGWNVVGTFAYISREQGTNMLLNFFFGTVVNAARGVSYQVMGAIQGFTSSVNVAFNPQLTQSYAEGNYDRTLKLMFSMSKITFFLFYVMCVPIIIEIDYILNLWLGNNVPEQTNIFTILVLINMLISNFNAPVTQLVFANGDNKMYQVCSTITNLSFLPLAFVFLLMGVDAISVFVLLIIFSIINQMVCLWVLSKKIVFFKIRQYCVSVILPSLIVFIVAPLLPYFVSHYLSESFLKFLAIFFLSVMSTMIFSYYLGCNSTERKMIKVSVLSFKQRFFK